MMTLDEMISCRRAPPLLVLCGALLLGPAAATRFVRARPTAARAAEFMAARCRGRPVNHDCAGATHPASRARAPPAGFAVVRVRRTVGRGAPAFARASRALRAWKVHTPGGASAVFVAPGRRVPRAAATAARCYGGVAWVLNPCVVGYELLDAAGARGGDRARAWAAVAAPGERFSAVSYSTLRGHLIAGEERLCVVLARDGAVECEVLSLSRGATAVGRALFPLMRPMQRRFFEDQLRTVARAAQGPG